MLPKSVIVVVSVCIGEMLALQRRPDARWQWREQQLGGANLALVIGRDRAVRLLHYSTSTRFLPLTAYTML